MINPNIQKYVDMQKRIYKDNIPNSTIECCSSLVGSPDTFNTDGSSFYDFMFDNVDNSEKIALDFGCGVGRMIGWFGGKFKHIDGIDTSDSMIASAKIYLEERKVQNYSLFHSVNGYNIEEIDGGKYDFVYSGWVLEHICVHQLREMLFGEFWRVLKPGGSISIIMQGGDKYLCNSICFQWYDNYYSAPSTNCTHDVKIDNFFDVTRDLHRIGFTNTSYSILPTKNYEQWQPPQWAGHQFTICIKAKKL